MLPSPKTFKDLSPLASANAVTRILKRLKNSCLVETPEERNYVFLFKTKRKPEKENLSAAERKIYEAIPDAGISKKLAEKQSAPCEKSTCICGG